MDEEYVPEFNCFVRRLISLTQGGYARLGDLGLNVHGLRAGWRSPISSGVLRAGSLGVVHIGDFRKWYIECGATSRAIEKVSLTLRGPVLYVDYETDPREIQDYWR